VELHATQEDAEQEEA